MLVIEQYSETTRPAIYRLRPFFDRHFKIPNFTNNIRLVGSVNGAVVKKALVENSNYKYYAGVYQDFLVEAESHASFIYFYLNGSIVHSPSTFYIRYTVQK